MKWTALSCDDRRSLRDTRDSSDVRSPPAETSKMIHDGPQALDLSIIVLYQIILTAAETCSQKVRQLSKHNKGVEVAMGTRME